MSLPMKVLGHWLFCERCRDPRYRVNQKTGDIERGGIVVPDITAEYHRDNTFWFTVLGVGNKVGQYRRPPTGLTEEAQKEYLVSGHDFKVGDKILCPDAHEWRVKRTGENEAFIDESHPIIVDPVGE